MSTLRNNLEQAKAEYTAARYPGDLGSLVDAMPAQTAGAHKAPWMRMGVALAMAACVLVGVGVVWTLVNSRPTNETKTASVPTTKNENIAAVAPGNDNIAVNSTDVATNNSTNTSDESFSIVPSAEYASFAVPAEEMSMPSMPSMPSYDDFVSEQTEKSTEETKTKEAL